MHPQAKQFKWEDTQGVAVEPKVPGNRTPERVGARDHEAPATPVKSQPLDSPREGSSPGVSDDEFNFSYKDATKRTTDRSKEISDPVVAALERVRKASSQRELAKAVHSIALFEGFQDERAAYNTIAKRLADIVADDRSHKDLVSEVHFTVRNLVPLPFAEAMRALAQGEGWHPECLVQEVGARAAFVEHYGTQLKAEEQEMHKRCPSIACLRGML